jgi:hypothetical protein
LTIGIRYATVRRQFSTLESGNKLERKLLDYQTHMFKLAPLLAYSFGMNFAAHHIFKEHTQLLQDLQNGDYKRLDLLHHLSAGYKAVFSRIAYDGIDSTR